MRKLVLEGYYDKDSGWEFEMPVVLMSPWQKLYHAGSVGDIEHFVEDITIDVDIGEGILRPDHAEYVDGNLDEYLDATNCFAKAKEGDENLKYWKAVVEWDDENFNITEQVGW